MHYLNLYHHRVPDLTEDEVIAVRREIAREVLADLAREWFGAGDEEPATVAGLLRRLLAQVEREG